MERFYNNWNEASLVFSNGTIKEVELFLKSDKMNAFLMDDLFHFLGRRNDLLLMSHFMLEDKRLLNTALVSACAYGSINVIGYLLSKEIVDPTYKSCLALKEALINKQQDSIALLLEDVRITDYLLGTI